MNREHVVGCPALRAGVRCTCQIVPSSRVKPPTRVEEIRRKFPNMVGTWGAEAITFLLAENERLRAENDTFSQQNRAWIRENTRLEARVAALEEALRALVHAIDCMHTIYGKQYVDQWWAKTRVHLDRALAAPALLEALESLEEVIRQNPHLSGERLARVSEMKDARAAIAQAKGETNG